jgi:peptidoglycan/LPS O-acetylase OafA/YrhL
MSRTSNRLPLLDAFKGIAAQLIVLHHLAFYGPMSDSASELAPALIGWLSEYGRFAVQAFLVISGFLVARALAPEGSLLPKHSPLAQIGSRYQKLGTPLFIALLLSIPLAAIARAWMDHDSIPGAPSPTQLLVHLFLLQDVLEVDALSAGVWYVAIDLQLFALSALLLWLARGIERRTGAHHALGPVFILLITAASLFHFNTQSHLDMWAIYFFGSWGMGMLAWWAAGQRRAPVFWIGCLALLGLAALTLEFRPRLGVALVVACTLAVARLSGGLHRWLDFRPLVFLGQVSYAIFLVHFPICLVINAAFTHLHPDVPVIQGAGIALAWGLSVLAGSWFHRGVEALLRGAPATTRGVAASANR